MKALPTWKRQKVKMSCSSIVIPAILLHKIHKNDAQNTQAGTLSYAETQVYTRD